MKHLFFWAVLYQLVYGICNYIQLRASNLVWITPAGLALFLFLLILWCLRTGRGESLGLWVRPRIAGRDLLFTALLLLPALCNVLAARDWTVSLPELCVLALAALAEEIFFRGFALKTLCRYGAIWGVVGSAALFALLHGLNLLQDIPLPEALLQILFAFLAGICYAGITLRSGSLLICSAAHCLVNITGATKSANTLSLYAAGIGIYALGAILYILWLSKAAKKEELS